MDQHGPELDPSELQGLEVVPGQNFHGYPEVKADAPPAPSAVKGSRKRLLWIVAGIGLVLIIVGAVVGGVLGSRNTASGSNASEGKGNPPPSPSESSAPKTKTNTTLKSIRPNSRLAVTGYRGDGDFQARLFYEGPDNVLRYSSFNSTSNAWTSSPPLSNLAPRAKTPIAATTWLSTTPPQMNVYFVDQTSLLRGQRFQDGATPANGLAADIYAYPMRIDTSASRLAGYHPHLISQDTNGKIRYMHWMPGDKWDNRTFDGVDAIGSSSCGLAGLPAAVSNFTAGSFLFRNTAGQMTSFVGSTNGVLRDEWAWAQGQVSTPIPADTAIGTFVYARSENLVNTYSLYQDSKGVLQVVWQNDASGWQGPQTFPALAGADNGTDIACLIQATWDYTGVALSTATDMNRCYFQSDGKVKEVWFDGKDWKDLGYLPIE